MIFHSPPKIFFLPPSQQGFISSVRTPGQRFSPTPGNYQACCLLNDANSSNAANSFFNNSLAFISDLCVCACVCAHTPFFKKNLPKQWVVSKTPKSDLTQIFYISTPIPTMYLQIEFSISVYSVPFLNGLRGVGGEIKKKRRVVGGRKRKRRERKLEGFRRQVPGCNTVMDREPYLCPPQDTFLHSQRPPARGSSPRHPYSPQMPALPHSFFPPLLSVSRAGW